MKLFAIAFIIVALVFSTYGQQFVQMESEGGAIFRSRDADPTSVTACEMCIEYYLKENGFRTSYFLASPQQLVELNPTEANGECCQHGLGFVCPTGGCSAHLFYMFPNYLPENYTDTHLLFSGNVGTKFDVPYPSEECTPGPDYEVCSYTELEYTINNEEQEITLGENSTYKVRKDSLLGRLRVEKWNFIATSTGLRLKIELGVLGLNAAEWRLQPQDLAISVDDLTPVEGFEYISIKDSKDRTAAISFAQAAVIDGNSAPVNISGVYSLVNGLGNGRSVFVDVPRFNDYTEIYFNLFFPTLTGDSASSSLQYSLFCIFAALVALFSL